MKRLFVLILLVSGLFMAKAQTHWTPVTGYESTMSVTGIIRIDNVEQTSTDLEIGAFWGDECRGAKIASLFPLTNQYTVPISIAGIDGDHITFRIYDHALNTELELDSENSLTFVTNGVIPSPGSFNWFEFAFTTPVIHNTAEGNWSDPDLWSTGSVPGSGAVVAIWYDCTVDADAQVAGLTIENGNTLTVAAGNTLTVTGDLYSNYDECLVILGGAQLINSTSDVHAKAKVDITAYTQKSKDTNGWHLISSAVNDMDIADSEFLTETYDLYRYNESTPAWENYRTGHPGFTTFENGRGYLYANSHTFSPAFAGVLNNAAVTYHVTHTSSKVLRGINMIGNPFPHNIYKGVGGAINDSHLASGYYTLSYDGEWETHTYDDAILPGQGILVITSATMDLTIAKTNAAATAEKATKGDVKRLKVKVSGNGHEDRAFAYFSEGNGLEKMENFSSSAATISIQDEEQKYAIAHVGEGCEEMDIVFDNTLNADYTITIEGMESFSYLHLIDNITGEDVDMLLEQSYTFHANGNEYAERFKVIMRDTTGFGENAETATFAYISGDNIVVNGEGVLEIIDMTGRIVNTMHINGLNMVNKPADGVYVLRIINGNDVKTQKIVVR